MSDCTTSAKLSSSTFLMIDPLGIADADAMFAGVSCMGGFGEVNYTYLNQETKISGAGTTLNITNHSMLFPSNGTDDGIFVHVVYVQGSCDHQVLVDVLYG